MRATIVTLSVHSELYLLLIPSWLRLAGMTLSHVYEHKFQRLEKRQLALRFATEMSMSSVEEYAAWAASGALLEPEAQQQALRRIKAMGGKPDLNRSLELFPTWIVKCSRMQCW